ncbi:MAG: S53 family peptidase [Isosphaeraceae bacterium]
MLTTGAAASTLAALTAEPNMNVLSVNSTMPTGDSPAQISAAYGIGGITFSGGVVGNGAGQTIAIVDAYSDPNIASDLAMFDAQYGLSAPPSFTVDNQGATTTDAGWSLETALDVEWAHAIAPQANIVLVEAPSASMSSLFDAVSYASTLPAVDVISMSWISSEFAGETRYDGLFTTPGGHTGITYVAASGDTGAAGGVTYPSASPNVLSVGGTTLGLSASGGYGSESAWSGSTGGYSRYELTPSYQVAALQAAGLGTGSRTTPDVSLNADPSTGYSVYDSVAYGGISGWFTVGGTSGAAPAWAGLVAIADQGLASVGQGSLTTGTLLNELYSLPSSDFNDVTSGSNGYSASTGYDLATGLGSPKAGQVVAGLLADATGTSSSSSGSSTSSTLSSSSSSGSGVTVITTSGGSGGRSTPTGGSGSTGGTITTIPVSPTNPTSPTRIHKKVVPKRIAHVRVHRTRIVKAKTTRRMAEVAHMAANRKAAHAAAAVQINAAATEMSSLTAQSVANVTGALAALTQEEARA